MSRPPPEHDAMPATPAIDDCWNRIGVQGDHRCPALAQHIHCRNCPVYASAAAVLLDREAPAGYLDERSLHFAQQRQDLARRTRSVALFRLGAEWLALPSAAVVEVASQRSVHSLPHRRGGSVLGLVNIRGELLICVSLAKSLGLDPVDDGPRTDTPGSAYPRLLVIRVDSGRLVVPVDEMHGIHRFDPEQLRALPVTVQKSTMRHATAMLEWNGRSVGLLDERLVTHTLNRSLA